MQRAARAVINLTHLRHNYSIARQYAGDSKVMCVVKADAYGHGMLEVADALDEADGFAVACVEEAIALRNHGVQQPITVFQGFSSAEDLQLCSVNGLWPVVHHESQLRLLEDTPVSESLTVWLKITTGMNRLGFVTDEVHSVWKKLNGLVSIRSIKLMTHMACADEDSPEDEESKTAKQIRLFESASSGIDAERSLANSATLINWPQARQQWVRPGIMLYGGAPFLPDYGPNLNLKPVMTLTSSVVAVNYRRAGDRVGYGATWHCPQDMNIATVSIGYGDGYPRGITQGTPILINGMRANIVGRVSMDLLTVDVSGMDVSVGDQAVLWGEGLSVNDIAAKANTISYELFCNVSKHVEKVFIR